jgi:hypothetical protein
MADIQNIDDFRVDYKGTTYSLLIPPPEDSAVVHDRTGEILKSLSLNEIVEGLAKADDLLRCAYNGVAGKGGLRATILGIQHDLKETCCTKALLALADFERSSKEVLANMKGMFHYLVQPGKIDLAMKYLARCSDSAQNLSAQASDLANEFHNLAAKTVLAAQDTEKEKGLTEDQKREFDRQAGELKAKIAEADEQSKQLAQLCDGLQKKYEDAHASAEKEADRAFAIGMVGAIMKPLAAGLGSAAAAYGASRTGGFTAAAQAAEHVTRPNSGESSGNEQGSQSSEEGSGNSESTPSSTEQPAAPANSEAADKKPKSDSTAGKEAALHGGAAAAKEAADSLSKEADKLDERAKGARDLEMEILRMQEKAQTARIAQASLLAKFAIELTNVKDASQITAATVYSLYIAIGALKKVANVLDDAALFWTQMQKFCSALNSSGFQADVNMLKSDPDEMINLFRTDNDIKANVVIYYASWIAISQVTKQYQVKAAEVREVMAKHFEENLDTNASMALARELGNKLYLDTQTEIKDATADRDAIGKQLTDKAA